MIVKVICDWCGQEFERHDYFLRGKKHHFCSRQCLADFSSKEKKPERYSELKDYTNIGSHFSEINRERNPTKMTPEVREKLREAHLGQGECKGYSKIYGERAHRVVMEQILGRKLKPEEVVHHRDFNRYNNAPENLQLFPNQAEHTRFHANYRWFIRELEKLEVEDAKQK